MQATARWAAQRYSKAQWVYAACPWAHTRASPPASSPPPRPPACTPHPLPTLPQQRWRRRPWARGHGQPGVSWRRSQLPLPVSPVSAAPAPDHRSRVGQSGARRADPPAQAWQRQQPAAAAAASAEPAPRGGREGRRSPERQCAAVILPKQPVAARAACEPGIRGQLWHAMAMATRPRTLPPCNFFGKVQKKLASQGRSMPSTQI